MPVIAAVGLMGGRTAVVAMGIVLRAIAVLADLELTPQEAGLLHGCRCRYRCRMGFVDFAKRGRMARAGLSGAGLARIRGPIRNRDRRIDAAFYAQTSRRHAERQRRRRLARIIQSGAQGFGFDPARVRGRFLAGLTLLTGGSGRSGICQGRALHSRKGRQMAVHGVVLRHSHRITGVSGSIRFRD